MIVVTGPHEIEKPTNRHIISTMSCSSSEGRRLRSVARTRNGDK